jgi:hypothetical protein
LLFDERRLADDVEATHRGSTFDSNLAWASARERWRQLTISSADHGADHVDDQLIALLVEARFRRRR